MIDSYSRHARVAPVLIVALPVGLLVLAVLPELRGLDRVVALILAVALLPLLDQLGRSGGRRLEPRLFDSWGGAPTTQLLRWRGAAGSEEHDRRHQAVERVTGIRLPSRQAEEADPALADRAYVAAARALRTLTRESTGLLAVENRNYGFRRNLRGLRSWGLVAVSLSLAGAGVRIGSTGPAGDHLAGYLALIGVDLVLLALWLFVVTESWVREAAWTYAERLLEEAEGLAVPAVPDAPDPSRESRSRVGTDAPTVAVLTALADEFAAVTAVLRDAAPLTDVPDGDPNHYSAGSLPSRDPDRQHRVVATILAHDGTRSAASVATDLLRSFPSIRCLIFSGIAGGVPEGIEPDRDVRLGDVLVAVDGVVDYDHTWTVDSSEHLRRHLDGLSADMLRAVQDLRASEPDVGAAVLAEAERVGAARFARPGQPDPLPARFDRSMPRVHYGAIGSADRLLRDAARRDLLSKRFWIRGVEMEASGLAVGAHLRGVPWFVVRGVADYCDDAKNDAWHGYASLTSAAFVAIMLRHCRPLGAASP